MERNRIKSYLKQCYWAGADLARTGTSLDFMSMENDIREPLIEIIMIVKDLTDRRTELMSVIENLLEQHERQIDMEDCGRRCSYPDKFPEWDRAWDNAQEVLNG